jgi:hypothetical protein
MQAQGLAFAENLGCRPFRRQPPAVSVELEARREQGTDRTLALGDHCWFEQPFWRRDPEVVREIENVHDQGYVERGLLNLDVEVTEGHRVRDRGPRARKKPGRKNRRHAPTHNEQW